MVCVDILVDNVLYMGTVNNSNKTWHVLIGNDRKKSLKNPWRPFEAYTLYSSPPLNYNTQQQLKYPPKIGGGICVIYMYIWGGLEGEDIYVCVYICVYIYVCIYVYLGGKLEGDVWVYICIFVGDIYVYIERETKQGCTHVDHNQLDDPLYLKSCTPILYCF